MAQLRRRYFSERFRFAENEFIIRVSYMKSTDIARILVV